MLCNFLKNQLAQRGKQIFQIAKILDLMSFELRESGKHITSYCAYSESHSLKKFGDRSCARQGREFGSPQGLMDNGLAGRQGSSLLLLHWHRLRREDAITTGGDQLSDTTSVGRRRNALLLSTKVGISGIHMVSLDTMAGGACYFLAGTKVSASYLAFVDTASLQPDEGGSPGSQFNLCWSGATVFFDWSTVVII